MSRLEHFDLGTGRRYVVSRGQYGDHHILAYDQQGPVAAAMVSGHARDITQPNHVDRNPYAVQGDINTGKAAHNVVEEESGQLRMAGGAFEPSKPYISWIGALPRGREQGIGTELVTVAQKTARAPLYADRLLSPAGSRHAIRHGLKPHPNNPERKPTISQQSMDRESVENGIEWLDTAIRRLGGG